MEGLYDSVQIIFEQAVSLSAVDNFSLQPSLEIFFHWVKPISSAQTRLLHAPDVQTMR